MTSVPLSTRPARLYGTTSGSTTLGTTSGTTTGEQETRLAQEPGETTSPPSQLRYTEMSEAAVSRALRMRQLLLVGFGAVGLVLVLALVLTLQGGQGGPAPSPAFPAAAPADAITFEEFLGGDFRARSFNGSWWSDTELQWKDQEGNLVTWDLTTNQTTVLVSHSLLSSLSSTGAQFRGFSPDQSLLLFSVDREPVWRHSYTARYLTFNPATNSSLAVEGPGGASRLQYCAWVENEQDRNILVLVHGNNLYWRPEAEEGPGADIALSTDGLADTVFNGIPDWVFEEEVLGVNYAHYINEPGTLIAYAKFNDSLVPDFKYPHYGDPEAVEQWQYPEYRTVRYPKAGHTNPTVSLHVRTIGEAASKPVEPPAEVTAWGEYLYTVADWTDVNLLSVTWMNRIQNASALSECREDGAAWQCQVLHTREQPGGWIEIAPPPVYGEGGLLVLLPSRQPSGLTFPHVALLAGGAEPVFLTKGEFVITEILAWDGDRAMVYLLGTDPAAPGARHLYTVGTDGSGQRCISCSLITSRGTTCQRSAVLLNWDLSHYIHSCLGQGLPEAVLRRTSDHAIVFELETNGELEQRLEGKALPDRVDTWVELEGGHRAPVKLLLPPHMEEGAKYPVLVYVYGGPGSQMVTDSWSVGWGDYLVTSRNIVYASIDGRGTGFQSNEFLFQVYRALGTVEMEDQIAGTRQLLAENPSLDPARTAIWGWSYGGFATAMTLEQDTDSVFSCGVSVAPVTSWLLYDSIYTERYMATPQENPGGYNHSVIAGIEGLRNKTWMLNHGVADDNVHFQHSMLLTKALERADIQFQQHSYPDENHGLGGVSRFLYHAMDDFWGSCLGSRPAPLK